MERPTSGRSNPIDETEGVQPKISSLGLFIELSGLGGHCGHGCGVSRRSAERKYTIDQNQHKEVPFIFICPRCAETRTLKKTTVVSKD